MKGKEEHIFYAIGITLLVCLFIPLSTTYAAPAAVQKGTVQPVTPQLQRVILEPTVQSVTLNPNIVSPSQTSTGTVILSGAAGAAGTTVNLTSSSTSVTIPAALTVAAGSTTAPFMVMVQQSAQGGNVTISAQNATGAGVVKQATLVIASDVQVKAVLFANDDTCSVQIRPGYSCQASVFLDKAASGSLKVNLSSSSSAVSVAGSVNIGAGATWVKVPVTIAATASPGQATISAVRDGPGGVAKQMTLNILAPAKIISFFVTPNAEPGTQIGGSATLDGWPPPAGMNVMLMSSSPSVTVPSSVPVVRITGHVSPQDYLGGIAAFAGTVASNASPGDVTIAAIVANSSSPGMNATLKIKKAQVASLSLGYIFPGRTEARQVSLDIPSASPITVNLSSSSADVTVPASVVIPANTTGAYFDVTARASASPQTVKISATRAGTGNVTKQADLVVRYVQVSKVVPPSETIKVGQSTPCEVTLEDTAGPGGIVVNLRAWSDSDPPVHISVPASVTVPAGQKSVTFPITGISVGQGGRISAVRSGSTVEVTPNYVINVYQ